jgi:hypothetical protein
MQSQEKKIKRLLESKDVENHKLGQLALLSVLDKDNALYWYLTLEPIKSSIKPDDDLYKKMTELLTWSAHTPGMECLAKMVTYIQINHPSHASIEKFFAYYNEYLYSLLSYKWTSEIRKSVKSQIPQLNVSTTPTKSNEDL